MFINNMPNNIKVFRYQVGATLLEAIISLVVFSIGALGIAALQTQTLIRSDDVKQRSIAIWKAQDLAARIKATDSVQNPAGLGQAYVAAIGSEVVAGVIGDFDNTGYTCPATAPTRCDDNGGSAIGACSDDDLVAFDVWSVLCDPASGVSAETLGQNDGENKVKNFDVALNTNANGEYFLYFEWLARASDDEDLTVTDINTNLCGTDVPVDSRLDAYCLRFR